MSNARQFEPPRRSGAETVLLMVQVSVATAIITSAGWLLVKYLANFIV